MDMVLFDCNGTILDDSPLIYGFYRYAVDRWGDGHPVSITELFQAIHDAGDYMVPYSEAGIDLDKEALNEGYEHYYRQRVSRIDLFPSVRETLESLERRGVKIGLVTLQARNLVEPFFRDFNIMKFFDDCRFESYDKTEDLKSIISNTGVDPDRALYVGDMPSDAEDARGAGLDHLLFFNGYVPMSALLSVSRVDKVIDSIREVLDKLH